MQLNSGSAYARHWYAHSLEAQHRLPEAMIEMRKALEMDPRVMVLLGEGDTAGAGRAIAKVRADHPELAGDPMFMTMFGVEAVLEGRFAEGRAALAKLEALRAQRYVDAFLALLPKRAHRNRLQFAVGRSMRSITRISTGALVAVSLRPSCSSIAVKIPGSAVSAGAAPPGASRVNLRAMS
jgi:hypothetical protein